MTEFANIDEILVVPQFHYDVAYLQTEEQYYPRCFDNFRQAIALMDANPDYRYTIEQPFLIEAFEKRCPDDFVRLTACQKRGQLEFGGALYVIPDMNIPCGEALIRHVLLGKRYVASRFGVDVRIAWIADTWGHSPSLPGIMRHAGIDTYIFSRGMRPELRKGEFIWRGLGETEIVAHWLPAGYSSIRFPSETEIENALELNMASATEENLRSVSQGIRNVLSQNTVLICNGGDMAPPQASAPSVVSRWQEQGLPVRFGKLAEYAEALHDSAAALPRIEADFNPLFVGAQASRIRLKQLNRKLENALLSIEALHASLRIGGANAPMPPIERAWKICLKNQFHDIISGTLVDGAYHDALRDYDTALSDVALAAETVSGEHGDIAVFNPSGFARSEWIETKAGAGQVNVQPYGWSPLPEKALPETIRTIAPNEDIVIENEFWRVVVGPSGVITSCLDQRTCEEFVGESWGNLVYKPDNGDLWRLDHSPLDGGSLQSALTEPGIDDPMSSGPDPLVNDGPVRQDRSRSERTLAQRNGKQTVTARGNLSFWQNSVGYETTISLIAGDPVIHFRTVCHPHGRHYRIYSCFATPWSTCTARHGIPFGAIIRDAKRYADQNYVEAIGPGKRGVRVLNAGLPGNAVVDGVASILLFRSAAMEYKAQSDSAFEDGEELIFEYGVRPITAADPGSAEREGERLNRPLLVAKRPEGAPLTPPLLSMPPNLHVDAFYATTSGDIILRVHEATGEPAEGRIVFGAAPHSVFASDGMETLGERLDVDGASIPVKLGSWQIATWRLRYGQE